MKKIDIFNLSKYLKNKGDNKLARIGHVNHTIDNINSKIDAPTNPTAGDALIFDGATNTWVNSAAPIGPQGPQGPQGVAGPVGPAGLTWQGQWDPTTSYVQDDAVGYNGASWFCIADIAGDPSNLDPETDTTSWALLAAQGAQGPQGPQGIQGTEPVKTAGIVSGTVSQNDPLNVIAFDIVTADAFSGPNIRLPENAPIGKEIIVRLNAFNASSVVQIRSFNLATTISINNSNSNSSSYSLTSWQTVRFISRGNNFWIAEAINGTNISFNGYTLSTSVGNYAITETILNTAATTPFSLADLNTLYPFFQFGVQVSQPGLKVYCPNIVGGGLVYIRTSATTWVSAPITNVV